MTTPYHTPTTSRYYIEDGLFVDLGSIVEMWHRQSDEQWCVRFAGMEGDTRYLHACGTRIYGALCAYRKSLT